MGTQAKLEEVVEGIRWITTTKGSRFPASYKLKTNMKKSITAFKAGSIERDADNNEQACRYWLEQGKVGDCFVHARRLSGVGDVELLQRETVDNESDTRAIRVTTRIFSLLHSNSTLCRIEEG